MDLKVSVRNYHQEPFQNYTTERVRGVHKDMEEQQQARPLEELQLQRLVNHQVATDQVIHLVEGILPLVGPHQRTHLEVGAPRTRWTRVELLPSAHLLMDQPTRSGDQTQAPATATTTATHSVVPVATAHQMRTPCRMLLRLLVRPMRSVHPRQPHQPRQRPLVLPLPLLQLLSVALRQVAVVRPTLSVHPRQPRQRPLVVPFPLLQLLLVGLRRQVVQVDLVPLRILALVVLHRPRRLLGEALRLLRHLLVEALHPLHRLLEQDQRVVLVEHSLQIPTRPLHLLEHLRRVGIRARRSEGIMGRPRRLSAIQHRRHHPLATPPAGGLLSGEEINKAVPVVAIIATLATHRVGGLLLEEEINKAAPVVVVVVVVVVVAETQGSLRASFLPKEDADLVTNANFRMKLAGEAGPTEAVTLVLVDGETKTWERMRPDLQCVSLNWPDSQKDDDLFSVAIYYHYYTTESDSSKIVIYILCASK
jgi:hypothetical protein